MPRNTLKMSFFVCTRVALYNTRVRTQIDIYNSRVHIIYVTLCISNPRVFLVYATVVSATHVRLLKMSKKRVF